MCIFKKTAKATKESEGFSMTKNTQPHEAESDTQKETTQNILDFGSAMTATPHGNIYCLTIIGQIEGHMTASSGTKTTK